MCSDQNGSTVTSSMCEFSMWDTVGCLKNDYSTPTVNNIYSSSACTVSNLGSIQPRI